MIAGGMCQIHHVVRPLSIGAQVADPLMTYLFSDRHLAHSGLQRDAMHDSWQRTHRQRCICCRISTAARWVLSQSVPSGG